jgi:fumarate reductase flavoprotein subunit
LGGIAHCNALARSDDPLAATLIIDNAIWESAGRAELVPPNPEMVLAGGTLITAPNLGMLAAHLSIPATTLAATISEYNRAVMANEGKKLNPPRTPGRMFGESRSSGPRVDVAPIATAPFYAIPLVAGISYTMGGIEIDAQARVIGRDGSPIPGLYAAGSCTGGIEGGRIGGYVGGYLKAVTLGLIAGETIGAACQRD